MIFLKNTVFCALNISNKIKKLDSITNVLMFKSNNILTTLTNVEKMLKT